MEQSIENMIVEKDESEVDNQLNLSKTMNDLKKEKKADMKLAKYITRSINLIKTTDRQDIVKGLKYIQAKLSNKTLDILKDNGGITSLLIVINLNYEDISDIALNILCHCSSRIVSNDYMRKQIMSNDVCKRLDDFLKNTQSQSIRRRVCRFIGNLAQVYEFSKEFHKMKTTCKILGLLFDTQTDDIKLVAIRAIRWLWETDVKMYQSDMLRIHSVKVIALLLNTDNVELFNYILRVLIIFTQNNSVQASRQIFEAGVFQILVDKLEEPLIKALMYNLSQSSDEIKYHLYCAGIIPRLIKLLEGDKIDRYLVATLCHLCSQSLVRAELRHTENGIQTLLSYLTNVSTGMFHKDILKAITGFNYDIRSLTMMLSMNLIPMLIEKLADYTKKHEVVHELTDDINELAPYSPEGSCSPPNASPASSSNRFYENLNEFSPVYSPRISPQLDDSDEDIGSEYNNSLKSSMSVPSEKKIDKYLSEDSYIIEILAQIVYQNKPHRELCSKNTINALLDYIVKIDYLQHKQNLEKSIKILRGILSCKDFFRTLLEEETILTIHQKFLRPRHIEECTYCSRLMSYGTTMMSVINTTAESGLGEGEITYGLAVGDDKMKYKFILLIPLVIRKPVLLQKLLFQNNFNKFLSIMDSRIEECVAAFCELFKTMRVTYPLPMEVCSHCHIQYVAKERNITFLLDDGSIVSANKESLCHNCPMFEAMFRVGNFKESILPQVKLMDITSECLTYFVRVADEFCECILPRNEPNVLLELITVTDRFLLPDLTEKIVNFVMKVALKPSSAPIIYDWSLKKGYQLPITENMADNVLRYLFAGDMLFSDRVDAVKEILNSDAKNTFLQEIEDLSRKSFVTYNKHYRQTT